MAFRPKHSSKDRLLEGESAYRMVIDGESVTAASSECFDAVYSYDGTVWASVPGGTANEVDEAIASARNRFESDAWWDRSATERGQLLFALADEIEAHTDELAHLEALTNGKLLHEMRGQVESLPDWHRY